MPARRVGILGGTFDPIHRGHIDLGRAAESALGLTELLLMPVNLPPHRPPPVASGFHRFAMAAIAAADFARWKASDVELSHPGPSFTATTLAWFHGHGHHPSELFFIVGADAFVAIESWKDYPAILDAAHFAVVARPGLSIDEITTRVPSIAGRVASAPRQRAGTRPRIILIDAPTANVSSTEIRARCAARRPLDGLVTRAIGQHIERHGLYSSASAGGADEDQQHDRAAGRLHGQD